MIERTDSQGTQNEKKLMQFLFTLSNSTSVDTHLHLRQQWLVSNREGEMLDTMMFRNGNNPVDIGKRAINIEELRTEWLTGPVLLRQPQSGWPEQLNTVFASDEQRIHAIFFTKQEEKKENCCQIIYAKRVEQTLTSINTKCR